MNEKAPANTIKEKIQKLKQLNAKLDTLLEQKRISPEDYKVKKQEIAKRYKQLQQIKANTSSAIAPAPSNESTSKNRPAAPTKQAPPIVEASPYAPPKATITTNNSGNETYELWNPNAAANWSIIFSPLFGAWLQSKNWEELGEHGNAKTSKIWMYMTPIVTLIGVLLGINIGLIILITWYVTEGKKQAKYLEENDIDYIKKPWAKVLGIATAILFALFFAIMLIFAFIL